MLQRDGLKVWDGCRQEEYVAYPYWLFGMANTLGLTNLSGLVGHGGCLGCHSFCGFPGRWKKGLSRYYPAALKPSDHDYDNVTNSTHPDVDLDLLPSLSHSRYAKAVSKLMTATDANYECLHLQTGIVCPSIILRLQPNQTLTVPHCLISDMMHGLCLNTPQHHVQIFCNALKPPLSGSNCKFAVLASDDVWKHHGALVE